MTPTIPKIELHLPNDFALLTDEANIEIINAVNDVLESNGYQQREQQSHNILNYANNT